MARKKTTPKKRHVRKEHHEEQHTRPAKEHHEEQHTRPAKEIVRQHSETTDIYFNGSFISTTKNPEMFVNDIRKKRRLGIINNQLNIAFCDSLNETRISSENGRVRRPLIIVENGKSKLTPAIIEKLNDGKANWTYLLNHGIIEYLDAMEEENAYIALNEEDIGKDHTHLELNAISMLGLSASLIAYPEYNRGDRINYGAKMIGQAIGHIASNFLNRMDTKFNIMMYPQEPLVRTNTSKPLCLYPEGQNIVVAITCFDGYNINDAIVLNKSSVERGLFRSIYFRTYEALKKRYWGGQEDEITVPEPGIKGHRGELAYVDLDDDGVINIETPVQSESVLIGRVSPLRFLSGEEFVTDIENKREASVVVRHGEKGVVDKILITETTDANHLYKIRIRDQRIPELGDKFASRHGQKGVVGVMVPHEDMPFTAEGIVPDIIFNPHAIPSRMTIGQLLEQLAGKAGALSGQKIDASAFKHTKEEEVRKIMKNLGFRDDGKQVMYNGKTGEVYNVLIFNGLSYYLKLDHMVADKIHARSRGPVTLLTKQPTEGRAKRGGLRIGEMEQQCLIGHGASLTLKERFDSDKAMIPICNKCGLIAIHDITKNRSYCPICKDSDVSWVETSYAFKLTLDELKSIGIYSKLNTTEI